MLKTFFFSFLILDLLKVKDET